MSILKEVIRWICLVLGLRRVPKEENQQRDQDRCSVRDGWSEMAARMRQDSTK
jgi:hypothetical protein